MSVIIVLLLLCVLAGQHQDRLLARYRAFRPAPVVEMVEPESDPEESMDALRRACVHLGMDAGHCQRDTNVELTGKVHELLHFAAKDLGRDLPMRTFGDLATILDRLER